MTGHKSLLRHALEGFSITFFGDALYKVTGVVTTFLVLAWVEPYDYGIWRLLLSALSAMSIVALTGVSGIAVADIARELGKGEKTRAYAVMWRIALIVISASIVAAVVLAFAAPVISLVSKIHLTLYLWVLAGSLLVGGVVSVLQVLFQARLEPMKALVLKNVGNLAYLVGLLLLLPYLKLGVLGLAIAYTLSVVIPVLAFLPYALKEFKEIRASRDRSAYPLKEVLVRRGGWALASDYVSIIESAAWPWIVGYFLSIVEVGYAGLAIVIVSQVYSVIPLQYLLRAILPRFAEDTARMQEWLSRGMKYSLWIHLVAATVVMAGATFVLPVFFPRYAVALPLAALLLIGVPFRAVGAVLTEWFYAARKQKDLFLTTSVPRLIALLLLPLLVWGAGMTGFVAWYLLSSLSMNLARFALARSSVRIDLNFSNLLLPDRTDKELFARVISGIKSRATLDKVGVRG